MVLTGCKCFLCYNSHIVGDDHFFGKSQYKAMHTITKFFQRNRSILNLCGNGIVPYNRSRNKLWKERNIQRYVKGIFLHGCPTKVHIQNIG